MKKRYAITYKQTIQPTYVTDDPHGDFPSPPPNGNFVGFKKIYDPAVQTIEVTALSKETARAVFISNITLQHCGRDYNVTDIIIDVARNIVSIDEVRV